MPDLVINRLLDDPNETDYLMTIGKYLLFICLLVNTGINLSPLKSWIATITKIGSSFTSNLGLSVVIVTVLGFLSYFLSDIDFIMDLAGGVFGIPMIFIFPALIGIKKRLFKNPAAHGFMYVWLVSWIAFMIFVIYKIFSGKLN